MRTIDWYTRAVLTVIAVLLAVLAMRPAPVQAQSDRAMIYIEPGTTTIRKPDGSGQGEGRMVVNMKTGEIWGFPTYLIGSPYPLDTTDTKPAVSKPVYLGRFDFDSMNQGH